MLNKPNRTVESSEGILSRERVPAVLNAEDMKERSGNDARMMALLLAACIAEFPRQTDSLIDDLRKNRPASAARMAHGIKGAALTASFDALAEFAGRMEDAIVARRLDEAALMGERLALILQASLREGRIFLDSLNG